MGTREQEGMVLVLGSWSVGTHPVLYTLVPCQSPLPNLSVLPVVLQARMRAVRSCRFDRAPFGDRAPRGAHTTRRACRRGSPYRMRGAPVVGRVRVRPARPFVRVWPVPPPRSPFVSRPERGCTRSGPPWPPLGSARAGQLPTAGVREVGMRIEGVRQWGCALVSCRALVVLVSPSPPSPLLFPLLCSLYPLPVLLSISLPHGSSIRPHPLRAIQLDHEWLAR